MRAGAAIVATEAVVRQPGFRVISADLRSSLATAAAWSIACRHPGLAPRLPAPAAPGSRFAIARPASVDVFVNSIS
jgi:hypothetical protein